MKRGKQKAKNRNGQTKSNRLTIIHQRRELFIAIYKKELKQQLWWEENGKQAKKRNHLADKESRQHIALFCCVSRDNEQALHKQSECCRSMRNRKCQSYSPEIRKKSQHVKRTERGYNEKRSKASQSKHQCREKKEKTKYLRNRWRSWQSLISVNWDCSHETESMKWQRWEWDKIDNKFDVTLPDLLCGLFLGLVCDHLKPCQGRKKQRKKGESWPSSHTGEISCEGKQTESLTQSFDWIGTERVEMLFGTIDSHWTSVDSRRLLCF